MESEASSRPHSLVKFAEEACRHIFAVSICRAEEVVAWDLTEQSRLLALRGLLCCTRRDEETVCITGFKRWRCDHEKAKTS